MKNLILKMTKTVAILALISNALAPFAKATPTDEQLHTLIRELNAFHGKVHHLDHLTPTLAKLATIGEVYTEGATLQSKTAALLGVDPATDKFNHSLAVQLDHYTALNIAYTQAMKAFHHFVSTHGRANYDEMDQMQRAVKHPHFNVLRSPVGLNPHHVMITLPTAAVAPPAPTLAPAHAGSAAGSAASGATPARSHYPTI